MLECLLAAASLFEPKIDPGSATRNLARRPPLPVLRKEVVCRSTIRRAARFLCRGRLSANRCCWRLTGLRRGEK